jgi:fused signal recognition particle receptor
MSLFKEKKGIFGRMSERLGDAFMLRASVDEELLEELEEILITSDIGMNTTEKIIEDLRRDIKVGQITNPEGVRKHLKADMIKLIDKGERHKIPESFPLVILIIGTNGSGKTTTIGKLAQMYRNEQKSVLIAAADTFRAAASQQLEVWGDRVGVNVIRHRDGSDPSAVIFDAITSAKAKNIDVLICDTAGRLQTKKNLMAELEKMNKVIDREYPGATKETLLVLDANTGKNAVSQAKEFGEITDLSGIILTKLDGTAKGGIAITIADEFDLPIKFVGLGEKLEDLAAFDPAEYIGGIFNE